MATAEEHLKKFVADLVFENMVLRAAVDSLNDKIKLLTPVIEEKS